MKKLLALAYLLAMPFYVLFAQNTIRGSVFDDKHKGREGVKIWINGDKGNTVKSASNGRFGLPQAPDTEIKKVEIDFKTYVVKDFVYDGRNLNIYIQNSDNHLKGEVIESNKVLSGATVVYKDGKVEKNATTNSKGVFMMYFDLDYKISSTAEISVNGRKITPNQLSFHDENALVSIRMDKIVEASFKTIFIKTVDNQALTNFSFFIDGKSVQTNGKALFVSNVALNDKTVFGVEKGEIVEKIWDEKTQKILLTVQLEQKTQDSNKNTDITQNKSEVSIPHDDLSKGFQELSTILNEEKQKLAEGREFLREKLVEMTAKIISDDKMPPQRRAMLEVEYETIEAMLYQNDQAYKEASARTSEVMQKMREAITERDSLNQLTKQQLQVIEEEKAEIEQSRFYISIFAIFTVILLIIGFFVARRIRQQKRQLEVQSKELQVAYQQIKSSNQELESKNLIIESKNANITASINYAERIQRSMLPQISQIKDILPQSFVFFKPRDIVSGDFYWLATHENKIIIAAVDCTGHGVPGAFMSMLGDTLMNQIIKVQHTFSPDQILSQMHEGVSSTLRQEETANRDGMDMAICVIDKSEKIIEFAGAKNPLIYFQNNEVHEIRGTSIPIGGRGRLRKEIEISFEKTQISFDVPTICYIFTDGYEDQFGGQEGRKFMKRNFINLLHRIHEKDFEEQNHILAQSMTDWQAHRSQVDDMLVIGFRLD